MNHNFFKSARPKNKISTSRFMHLVSFIATLRLPTFSANKGMNRNKLQAFIGTGGFRSSCRLISRACN